MIRCKQPGCDVSTSGKCLEGFTPIEECPYHSSEESVDNIRPSDELALDLIDLPSGEALTDAIAGEVARDAVTRLIVVAGPVGSGKTTILTSIYEGFLMGPVANLLFKGSRTLVGFERRCHLGRIESGRESASTSHTSIREGVAFLHIEVAPTRATAGAQRTHLLLSDISGELFRRLRDSSDAIAGLNGLRRADNLCVVVDGERLTRREDRYAAANDTRSILRSILESGILPDACAIDLVISKWDVVASLESPQQKETLKYIEMFKQIISSLVSQTRVLTFNEVAARPTSQKLPFAHGVPTLMKQWVEPDAKPTPPSLHLPKRDRDSREMSRYSEAMLKVHQTENVYDIFTH